MTLATLRPSRQAYHTEDRSLGTPRCGAAIWNVEATWLETGGEWERGDHPPSQSSRYASAYLQGFMLIPVLLLGMLQKDSLCGPYLTHMGLDLEMRGACQPHRDGKGWGSGCSPRRTPSFLIFLFWGATMVISMWRLKSKCSFHVLGFWFFFLFFLVKY